jgi:hypothetical protein
VIVVGDVVATVIVDGDVVADVRLDDATSLAARR